jgi:putative hydrolase of the HAD superfamily
MDALKVVLFDLDDTLFAHRAAVASGVTAYLRTTDRLADVDDPSAEVARWYLLEELHYHRYLSGEISYLEQRRARARGFTEPFGIPLDDDAEADEWFASYLVGYENAWMLHDDALRCLDALAPLSLGVITNGERPFQQRKLDRCGLTPYMEHIIASGEVGFTKPDPRIFAAACERFGVEPGDAMYVGDRFATDALGAAAAGLTGVWLDRAGAASPAQRDEARAAGVHIIRSLDEVLGLAAARASSNSAPP